MKCIEYYFLYLFIITNTTNVLSQGKILSSQQLSDAPWFYDLEEANKNPEKVYNFSFTVCSYLLTVLITEL